MVEHRPLVVAKDGTTEQDLTIQEFGVHLVAAPGQSVSTGLRDLRKGRYSAVCTNTRPGMRVTVVVE